jgi:hypothetical protein
MIKVFQLDETNTIVGIFNYENKPHFVDVDPRFITAPAGTENVKPYWKKVGNIWVPPSNTVSQEVVPTLISAFQAQAALAQAGLLDQVTEYISTADPVMKLRWDKAPEFSRSNPAVLAIAAELGISNTTLDELFIAGSKIQL